jgi:hypothetical protein
MKGGRPVPHVQELTNGELDERRQAILNRVGLTYEELAQRATARSLAGEEWAAWDEIREIDFLRDR